MCAPRQSFVGPEDLKGWTLSPFAAFALLDQRFKEYLPCTQVGRRVGVVTKKRVVLGNIAGKR